MWNEIKSDDNILELMKIYGNFHDSCIKELKYISGAFVNPDLSMNPMNNSRNLRMIFQRQCKDPMAIEMEFSELVSLNLNPNDENYTCELLDVAMFFENGYIYWGDSDWFAVQKEAYEGTWICAKKAKWRIVDEYIGEEEVYGAYR